MSTILIHASLWVLQADAAEAPAGPLAGLTGIVPIFIVLAIFYVMIVLPGNKQRRAREALQRSLKADDEVITDSGIYGRIVKVEEKVMTLEVADKVKIRILGERITGKVDDKKLPIQASK